MCASGAKVPRKVQNRDLHGSINNVIFPYFNEIVAKFRNISRPLRKIQNAVWTQMLSGQIFHFSPAKDISYNAKFVTFWYPNPDSMLLLYKIVVFSYVCYWFSNRSIKFVNCGAVFSKVRFFWQRYIYIENIAAGKLFSKVVIRC